MIPSNGKNVFTELGIQDIPDFLAPLGFLPNELDSMRYNEFGLPITDSLSTLYRIINVLIEYNPRNKPVRKETKTELDVLVRQYVDLNNEEYERAKEIVNQREKVKEAIKKQLKGMNQHIYRLRTDELDAIVGFEVKQYQKVDVDAIPPEIKNKYIKYQEIWRETPPVILRRQQ